MQSCLDSYFILGRFPSPLLLYLECGHCLLKNARFLYSNRGSTTRRQLKIILMPLGHACSRRWHICHFLLSFSVILIMLNSQNSSLDGFVSVFLVVIPGTCLAAGFETRYDANSDLIYTVSVHDILHTYFSPQFPAYGVQPKPQE